VADLWEVITQLQEEHNEAVRRANANIIELRTKIDGLVRENVKLTHRVAEINQREELWRGGTPTDRLLRLERRVYKLEENLAPDEEDEDEEPTAIDRIQSVYGTLYSWAYAHGDQDEMAVVRRMQFELELALKELTSGTS
jgi:chromosome segregation ATPase